MSDAELRRLKRRLSDRLLSTDGVSGVGTAGGRLTIYLEGGSKAVRDKVAALVRSEAPNAPVQYVVIGRLRAHDAL